MKNITQNKNEIIKIEPINIDLFKKDELKKIGNKNALLSQIPSMMAAKQLSSAYKIVLPPGASGKLMEYKNGLLGTPLVENGEIVGHAGLESISGMVSPMLIFTAASIITGQYFLSQINKSLGDILAEVKKITDLFLLKEESKLFSYSLFLNKVVQEYSYINSSPHLKTATLCNIQRVISQILAAIYFYGNHSIAELKAISNDSFKKKLTTEKISKNLGATKIAFDLYNMFVILEFSLSQSFDTTTIENAKERLHCESNEIFPLVEEILSAYRKMQKNLISKATTFSQQEEFGNFQEELKTLNIGINKEYIKRSTSKIECDFDELKQIDKNGLEYYVLTDGVYINV